MQKYVVGIIARWSLFLFLMEEMATRREKRQESVVGVGRGSERITKVSASSLFHT